MHRGSKIVSFLVVIIVFVAIAIVLHHPSFHRYLLTLVQRGYGWQIILSDSKVALWRGRVEVHGLEISGGKFRMTADRLLADLSPLSAIRGKLIVTDFEIDNPAVYFETGRKGPEPSAPDLIRRFFARMEKSWALKNLILPRIVITRLSLYPSEGKAVHVGKAILRIEPTLFREIETSVDLEDASGLFPSLHRLRFVAAARKDGLKLKNLELDAEKVRLTVKGEWKGDLEKGSLAAAGTLEASRVLSEPLGFALQARLDRGLAEIGKIEARLGKAHFEGKGNFDTEKQGYNLAFTAKELAVESLFQKLPSVVLGPARGIAELEGKAEGHLPDMRANATAIIRGFRHGPIEARKVNGTLKLNWPELDFEAFVQPGEEGHTEAHVRGGVLFKHLPGREKLQAVAKPIDVQFENASLQEFLPSLKIAGGLEGEMHLVGVEGTSVQGSAHAKVTNGSWAFGPVSSLETDVGFHPGGKISFQRTAVEIPGLIPFEWPGTIDLDTSGESIPFTGEPVAGVSVRGSYQKESGEFRIDPLQVRREGGNLDGTLRLLPGGRGEAKLKGTLNLEWLRFYPSLFREATGTANIDLSATGSTREPVIRGVVEFLEDEIGIRGFPQTVSDLEGTLRIDGPTLSPKLSGQLGDGTFRLGGSLRLSQLRAEAFDLTLQGVNLTVSRPTVYKIDFDADMTLKGASPSPRLEGRIDIVDGVYLKPFVIRELVLKPFESPAEPAPWEKAAEDVVLQLVLRNSGDLRIKNNVASILLRSDLKVGGRYGRPRFEGALTATEGTFHYLGDDFALNEGRLEFTDPSKGEPYLTLVAQEEIPPDTLVLIEVKGHLSNLDVTLSSSPSLPREDILSLIAFGMTEDEIRESGRSRRSLSATIMASEISGVLERPISRKTGLDIFRLEASESGTPSRLSIGKNITDRFSLELTNDLAPETAERTVQANYYLTDNILLKGFRTQTAGTNPKYQFNVSFRFRLY